jgi:hypothetical protein
MPAMSSKDAPEETPWDSKTSERFNRCVRVRSQHYGQSDVERGDKLADIGSIVNDLENSSTLVKKLHQGV